MYEWQEAGVHLLQSLDSNMPFKRFLQIKIHVLYMYVPFFYSDTMNKTQCISCVQRGQFTWVLLNPSEIPVQLIKPCSVHPPAKEKETYKIQ